jgi:hypothetical protein
MFAGRVHVRRPFYARQWNRRRRPCDCRVPLCSSLCWRRDVVPMLPRLHRYEVCPRNCERPTSRPVHRKTCFRLPADSAEPRTALASALFRRFGGRCGACDAGYYGVSGQCYECGDKSLVLFLAYVVPVFMILSLTCFLFWSGKFALPRHLQRSCLIEGAMAMRVCCSFVGKSAACHGAVSRHGELRVTAGLREQALAHS